MKGNILGADGIRAIAALSVLIHHFFERLNAEKQSEAVQSLQQFALLGEAGVSVFFVLSGMLLSRPFWQNYVEQKPFPSIRDFMARRAVRIVPGFYASLIVSFVVAWYLWHPTDFVWLRLLAGLTFTSGFHYVTLFPTEINGPLWSISFEVFCYVLMPALMALIFWGLPHRGIGVAFAFWVAAFALVLGANQLVQVYLQPSDYHRGWEYGLIGGAKEWMPGYNVVGMFAHYVWGVLAAGLIVWFQTQPRWTECLKNRWVFDGVAGLVLLLTLGFLWQMHDGSGFGQSWQNQPYFFPYFPLLTMFLLATLPFTRVVGHWFDNRFFRFTAKVSFGIYIWHFLILELYRDRLNPQYSYMGMSDLSQWLLISAALLGVSYIAAVLSYKLIEEPALQWHRRRREQRKGAGEPA